MRMYSLSNLSSYSRENEHGFLWLKNVKFLGKEDKS
jgi:hypothetical protein